MEYDAVIIGAGPSGLAAAARLSHFGRRVCLLEAHHRLGGMSSWHHVQGREISSGLHAFTNCNRDGRGGPLWKLLRQLRIKPEELNLRFQGQSSIRFPGVQLNFSNDLDCIRDAVHRAFPASADGFDRFRTRIRETDEGELTAIQQSARDVMESYIDDPLLADMLFCPVMFYGNPGGVGDGRDAERSRPDMDWLLFCVMWKCLFESGIGYPAAGMRPLWEMLARRIEADGGVIRMRSRVASFRTLGDRVAAAILESGEEVAGRVFFSSAGGAETRDMLMEEPRGPAIPVGRISVAEGICLLDCETPETGMRDTVTFFSFTEQLRFRRPTGLVEESCGVLCAPGNYLPPGGTESNLLKLSQIANYDAWNTLGSDEYASAKSRTAAGMARVLDKLGVTPMRSRTPGDLSVWDDLFTPVTIRRFTGHAGGALYGSPVKSRTGATARSNLFLIGADQGFHGIVGAMLSGVAMVNLHLLAKMEPQEP